MPLQEPATVATMERGGEGKSEVLIMTGGEPAHFGRVAGLFARQPGEAAGAATIFTPRRRSTSRFGAPNPAAAAAHAAYAVVHVRTVPNHPTVVRQDGPLPNPITPRVSHKGRAHSRRKGRGLGRVGTSRGRKPRLSIEAYRCEAGTSVSCAGEAVGCV